MAMLALPFAGFTKTGYLAFPDSTSAKTHPYSCMTWHTYICDQSANYTLYIYQETSHKVRTKNLLPLFLQLQNFLYSLQEVKVQDL